MTDESSDTFEIRRAPNGKYYVWGNGELICVPNGSLHYFGTEHDARVFLTDRDRAEIGKIAAWQVSEHGNETA